MVIIIIIIIVVVVVVVAPTFHEAQIEHYNMSPSLVIVCTRNVRHIKL